MLKDDWIQSRVSLFNRSLAATVAAVIATTFCLVCIEPVHAQERVRSSAGRLQIESFRNPESFFRIGPFEEELIGTMGIEYTDNADLTNTNKISRFSIYQAIDLNTTWVLSHLNQLQFKFGGKLSEDFYGNGKNRVVFAIYPDSNLQFQFAISNFRVRLFDHFSYIQNPTTDPTVTNTTYLNRLTNTVGAAVDADVGLAVLSLSADYTYSRDNGSNVQGQQTSNATRNSFRLGSDVTFQYSPSIRYGLESSLTRSTGTGDGSQNVTGFSIGPFVNGKLSPLTDFNLAGGVNLINTKPSVGPGYYFSAVIRHQFNRNFQLVFSGSRDTVFTTGTSLSEETVLRLAVQLNLTRYITLTGAPFATFGDEKTGINQGTFEQYGVEINLAWKPHRRWITQLSYDFTRREGANSADSYIQNLVAFQVSYRF